jgi:hypothetical protein
VYETAIRIARITNAGTEATEYLAMGFRRSVVMTNLQSRLLHFLIGIGQSNVYSEGSEVTAGEEERIASTLSHRRDGVSRSADGG